MAKKERQAEQAEQVQETQSPEQVQEVDETQSIIDQNLRFYNQGCEVPDDALKEIKAGRLKGMSDVNPMWRMKRMTEIFGPCGIGWKYTIDKQWLEQYGDEIKCFCNVSLYVRDPETKEWSEPIPGSGGSSMVSKERNGPYVNDEAYKMALTDALSIAMKPLGIGGNIWYGPKATGHNESKYEDYANGQQQKQTQYKQAAKSTSALAFTGEQLKQAIEEMSAVKSRQEFENCWLKWSNSVPALCHNGTEFYKVGCSKAQQFPR